MHWKHWNLALFIPIWKKILRSFLQNWTTIFWNLSWIIYHQIPKYTNCFAKFTESEIVLWISTTCQIWNSTFLWNGIWEILSLKWRKEPIVSQDFSKIQYRSGRMEHRPNNFTSWNRICIHYSNETCFCLDYSTKMRKKEFPCENSNKTILANIWASQDRVLFCLG